MALLSRALPYVPAELLASAGALSQLQRLREGAKVSISTAEGAALFVDVAGFSSLARSLTRSDAASSAEKLTSTLNEYFLQLISRLHAHGAEILLFAGDAVVAFIAATAERSLREAAAQAVEAALDVQAIDFTRRRRRLTAHTGVGAGELDTYVLQGSARAAQVLYAGDVIAQVCEAQRASKEGDVVLSAPLHEMLAIDGSFRTEPLQSGPFFRLLPQPDWHGPRAGPFVDVVGGHAQPAGELCACGAPQRASARGAAASLAPYADQILRIVPAAAAAHEENALWGSDIRTVFTVFASFPELDSCEGAACAEQPPAAAHTARKTSRCVDTEEQPAARHAARFGQVVRSVHRVAEEFGGSVNKIALDDKGASAIIGFGLPGGFAHEDDAERAVRAALALQSWFEESGAPFACGIAAGRTFCGTLGAPCRKEYALIGDSVILAARLMSTARATIVPAAGGGTPRIARRQEILVDSSVVDAVAAHGRPTSFTFDSLPAVRAKGFAEPVPIWRPRAGPRDGLHVLTAPTLPGRPPSRFDSNSRLLRRGGSVAGPAGASGASGRRSYASLFGREEELEQALATVEALAALGCGSTLVLEGDAGMGKTRLLREVQRACADRGVLVLATAATAVDETTPLWALRGIVASIANVSSGDALRADLESRRLLPANDADLIWAHLFGGAAASRPTSTDHKDEECVALPTDGDSSYRSYRRLGADFGVALVTQLSDTLSRLLHAVESAAAPAPARQPLCVTVEDCHWMDSASWFVLRCLRDTCPRLLLVLTARPMADAPRDYLVLSGRAEASRGASPSRDPYRAVVSGAGNLCGLVFEERERLESALAAGPPGSAFNSYKSVHLPPAAAVARSRNPSLPDVINMNFLPCDKDDHNKSARTSTRRDGASPTAPVSDHLLANGLLGRLPPLAVELSIRRASRPLSPSIATERKGHLPRLPSPVPVVRVRLAPLAPPAARALLAALSDREQMALQWPPDAVDIVLEKSAGVPLFLVELCRQRAAIARGSPDSALPFAVPETIQQIVLARVDRMPSYAQSVLKLLAVAGSRFTPALAAAIDPSSINGPSGVFRAFRQLRKAGLIGACDDIGSGSTFTGSDHESDEDEDGGGGGGDREPNWPPPDTPFSFSHALVQEAVYGSIPEAHRREVHRRLAIRLEARPDVDSALLAAHWKGAGDIERALSHLERAAWAAYRTNALLEARRLLGELVATIDEHELAGPLARPLPPSLRPRSVVGTDGSAWPPPLGRRDSRPVASPEKHARWLIARTSALNMRARAEYYGGDLDVSGDAAEACIDGVHAGWLPSKPLGRLATAALVVRALRAAWRVQKPSRDRRGSKYLWLQRPENAELRDAVIEALTLCAGIGLAKASFGGRGGMGWVISSMLRAYEISDGSPAEMHGLPDIRVWSNFATFIDALGVHDQAPFLMDRALRLAEALDTDTGRAAVHFHNALQHAAGGRLHEAAAEYWLTIGVRRPQPNTHDVLVVQCLVLILLGDFGKVQHVLDEAQVYASRLGADQIGSLLADTGGALLALVTGREVLAAAHLSRSEEALRSRGSFRWWIPVLSQCTRLVLHWRRGELSSAWDIAVGVASTWRKERETLMWQAAALVAVLLDFALWARADARASLAAAGGGPGTGRFGWLGCGRPAVGSRSAVYAQPTPSGLWPAGDVGAARRAERFAAEVVGLVEHGRRHRVPMLAPFCALARAEYASGAKRLAALRDAAAGFARSSMRPFEALAQLRLARSERDPAASIAAAEAAARIAGDIGLVIPAMGRPPGPPDEFVPMWV